MPYDFQRYAAELVELIRLSDRPGWSPEFCARMYLEHAYQVGGQRLLADCLNVVQTDTQTKGEQ